MTIEVIKDRYFIGIWFVTDRASMDFLLACYRDKDGPFRVTYRFRYYADTRVFDSEDEKSWWTGVTGEGKSEAQCEAEMEKIAGVVLMGCEGRYTEKIDLHTDDVGLILEKMKAASFIHTKQELLQ